MIIGGEIAMGRSGQGKSKIRGKMNQKISRYNARRL